MPRFHLTAAVAPLALAACLQPDEPSPPEHEAAAIVEPPVPLVLPVEVMPTVEADFSSNTFRTLRTFTLSASAEATLDAGGKLWLQGHGLGYRDGHTDLGGLPLRDGKASIKLNEGPWVDLTNANVTIAYPEIAYQGIGGGFRTVRLTVENATLCGNTGLNCFRPSNVIAFRFNGTDGNSSGYRIIDLDLLDANDVRVVDHTITEDPEVAWGEPAAGDPDVAAGERLWRARNALYDGPGGAPMIASCSDCHAQDGTDLEYFAFSDRSIITRSVFHHLSYSQGQQIAKYIRSNDAVRRGRPWNPPYQPGPNHDDNAPDAWAAGQGLGAVLDREDATMFAAIFPNGADTPEEIVETILGTGLDATTLNLRKVPIAIQLPDWNSWLPEVHPLDLWGVCAWENAGDGTFAARIPTATADLPAAPAVADLNGDDVPDLISTYYDGNPWDNDDGVHIRFGDPRAPGTWSPPISLVIGGNPADLAVVDLDGDLDRDLVLVDGIASDVVVVLNNGLGSLGAAARRDTGSGPIALTTGDFDGDGDLDVATANNGGDSVTVLSNDGAGALTATATVPVGDGPYDIVSGDLDGDGALDLAIANALAAGGEIAVLTGAGDGTFTYQGAHTSGTYPHALAAGDLDGDLDLDLAAITAANVLVVMSNDGSGNFARSTHPTGETPIDVTVADLDRDGRDDVVTVNANSDRSYTRANVYRQQLDGTLAAPVTYELGGPPTGVAVGDSNQDFASDLVVTTGDFGTYAVPGVINVLRGNDCGVPEHTEAPVPMVYDSLRTALTAFDRDDATQLAALPNVLGKLIGSVHVFVGSGYVAGEANQKGFRTVRSAVLDAAVRGRLYSHELVKRSLAQWTAVKYWELMREFDLETLGKALYGEDDGEVLEWPTGGYQSVFFVAPHLVSGNQNHFTDPVDYPDYVTAADHNVFVHGDACDDAPACTIERHNAQSGIEGDFDSTAWYHLQMLLHAGARSRNVPFDSAVSPVDWPYVLEHIDDVPRDIMDADPAVSPAHDDPPWETLRFLASLIKLYQMRNNQMGPALIGWSMRDVSPRILVGNWRGEADDTELLEQLDTNLRYRRAGLRLDVTEAFLRVFLAVVKSDDDLFGTESWPRLTQYFLDVDDRRASWFRIDEVDVEPTRGPSPGGWEFVSQGMFSHANDICRTIPRLRALYAAAGASQAKVDELEVWAEGMWPGPGGTASPQDFSARCP